MESSENAATGKKSGIREVVYYGAHDAPARGDENELVDLILFVWSRRKVLFAAVVVAGIVGFVSLGVIGDSQPGSSVSSVLEIEGVYLDSYVPIVPVNTMVHRINLSSIPYFAALGSFAHLKPFIESTRIEPLAGTFMIKITNTVAPELTAEMALFHEALLKRLLEELEASSAIAQGSARHDLLSVRSRIVSLERQLISLQGKPALASEMQPATESALTKVANPAVDSLRSEIGILHERARLLETGLSRRGSQALIVGKISEYPEQGSNILAYVAIAALSLFVAVMVFAGTLLVMKVKARIAAED